MPMLTRRFMPVLTATAGAFLAIAFLSSALANADVITYDIVPDFEDPSTQITSVTGFPPFDQTISESGMFSVNGDLFSGNATYYSDMFGLQNVEFETGSAAFPEEIINETSFGNGYENVYTDLVGPVPGSPDTITDNLITPFGDFNIPTTFDALADVPSPFAAAAADTDFSSFVSVLDADWTTLVTDFGALF